MTTPLIRPAAPPPPPTRRRHHPNRHCHHPNRHCHHPNRHCHHPNRRRHHPNRRHHTRTAATTTRTAATTTRTAATTTRTAAVRPSARSVPFRFGIGQIPGRFRRGSARSRPSLPGKQCPAGTGIGPAGSNRHLGWKCPRFVSGLSGDGSGLAGSDGGRCDSRLRCRRLDSSEALTRSQLTTLTLTAPLPDRLEIVRYRTSVCSRSLVHWKCERIVRIELAANVLSELNDALADSAPQQTRRAIKPRITGHNGPPTWKETAAPTTQAAEAAWVLPRSKSGVPAGSRCYPAVLSLRLRTMSTGRLDRSRQGVVRYVGVSGVRPDLPGTG